MPTDAELVGLAAATYDPKTVAWDYWFDGSEPDGICAGIKDNILALRGSFCTLDWERDFEIMKAGKPKTHPQFGIIHAGFDEGMDEFFQKITNLLGDGACFTGHSLGAGRAWLMAGRYVLAGRTPSHIAVFGAPKPGGLQFARFLAPYSKSSYRNGLDPIPEVPMWIGSEIAIAPSEPNALQIEPTEWSEGTMSYHNIGLYKLGVTAVAHV